MVNSQKFTKEYQMVITHQLIEDLLDNRKLQNLQPKRILLDYLLK
jgi:hypothetical protein